MPDKTLEKLTSDDAAAYLMRPKTAFAFVGRDSDSRDKQEILSERKAIKALKERAAIVLDMPRGQQRDLEITRVYRALAERQVFADAMHAGTREHAIIQWVFKDAYTTQKECRPVPEHKRTKFARTKGAKRVGK